MLSRVNLIEHIHLGHAKGGLEVLKGLFGLEILFIEEVIEDVLIALDKPL